MSVLGGKENFKTKYRLYLSNVLFYGFNWF